MFLDAMARYDAAYYGFCNGDILFDSGLVNTLQGLESYKHVLKNIMVIGKRKNYYMKRYALNLCKYDILTWPPSNIRFSCFHTERLRWHCCFGIRRFLLHSDTE